MTIKSPHPQDHIATKSHVAMTVTGLCLSLLLVFVGLRESTLLNSLDHFCYDTFLQLLPEKTSSEVVLVDIDEISLSTMGQWPWPRYRLAALIKKISASGASAIGLDIIMPEPDRTSLMNIQKRTINIPNLQSISPLTPPSLKPETT